MMTDITRTELAERINRVRAKSVCSYMNPKFCDCKYGAKLSGEQTGCPELRLVVELLRSMSDSEFEWLLTK